MVHVRLRLPDYHRWFLLAPSCAHGAEWGSIGEIYELWLPGALWDV